ncbi:hypothetical protein [Pseudoalteromonas sp. MMG005]|uniref:hypothetical protein n=1 Tax=Pseudoalteromonas sp. MMG005 TaxID=2822682 RepID=UPI001B3A2C9D|nr:hypothetical protein [Pseudoalteromonas sp. MMG005]MBQ4844574.1 hypothetical protein [Pseudoalteromonas sp. MMG005]
MDKDIEENLSDLYSAIIEIESCLAKVAYKFTAEEDFSKVRSIRELQLVYWSEIIQRFHVCGATTILRLKKWYEAIDSSYKSKNYYGFCASLRGLLEACSDSFYSIGKVIIPISENFSHIKSAIDGKATELVLATEIENELIHYIYGRKLSASERESFEDSHKAKQVRQYLDSIQSENLNSLYSELCQVSHPSLMSFTPFMMETSDHRLVLHNEFIDEELNKNLLERHKSTIHETTVFALGPALCSLKLVNLLSGSLLEALHTDERAFENLGEYGLWVKLEAIIDG